MNRVFLSMTVMAGLASGCGQTSEPPSSAAASKPVAAEAAAAPASLDFDASKVVYVTLKLPGMS